MDDETRTERWLDRRIATARTPRTAAVVIAFVTTSITIGAGLVMTLIDRQDFPTVGAGMWWAVQTVTTVGYGDRVPETVAGQLVAAFVMLLGIGFVTVITAAITSAFVTRVTPAAAVRHGRRPVRRAAAEDRRAPRTDRSGAAEPAARLTALSTFRGAGL